MDERVVQFRVGVMVLATLIITAILVLLFGELPAMVRGTYTIYMHFPEARGVSADTPVRKSGILIGRVSNVEFAEGGGVLVTAKIRNEITLHRNEIAKVSSSLLGGDGEIQIVPARDDTLPSDPLKNGDLMVGQGPPADPIQVVGRLEGDLSTAINSIGKTSDQIGQLAGQVNELLRGNGEQISRIVNKVEATLDGLQVAVGNINDLLGEGTPAPQPSQGPTPDETGAAPHAGDPAVVVEPVPGSALGPRTRGRMREALDQLPQLMAETRDAVRRIQAAADSANKNLTNLEGFTEPLGERGPQLIANIDNSTRRLDSVLQDIGTFAQRLNNSNGTLSQLVNNPDLYQRLNSVACNLDQLTKELRPIIHDARVFSDKIARHPEQLGVRGALDRSSGVK